MCLDAMRKAFPVTDSLQRTTKFFYTPTFRQSKAGIPIGPNSSTPASSRHMLNLYTTPAPAFEVRAWASPLCHKMNDLQCVSLKCKVVSFEYCFYGFLLIVMKKVVTFITELCCHLSLQVPNEKDALYLHLLFALKDPSVGTLESNFASTIFYAFVALQVFSPLIVEALCNFLQKLFAKTFTYLPVLVILCFVTGSMSQFLCFLYYFNVRCYYYLHCMSLVSKNAGKCGHCY